MIKKLLITAMCSVFAATSMFAVNYVKNYSPNTDETCPMTTKYIGLSEWSVLTKQQLSSPFNVYYWLHKEIPAFGKYGDPYDYRKKLLCLNLLPESLQLAPKALLLALGKQLLFWESDLDSFNNEKLADELLKVIVSNKFKLYVCATITGEHQDDKSDQQGKEINMLYHGLLASFPLKRFGNPKNGNFAAKVEMGLYPVDGVTNAGKGSINIGSIAKQDVSCHDLRCSPDNAKLKLTGDVSVFWSVGKFDDVITITHNCLLNKSDDCEKVKKVIHQKDLEKVVADLAKLFPNNKAMQGVVDFYKTVACI